MKKLLKSILRFIWNFLIGFLTFVLSIPRFIWNFLKLLIKEIWSGIKEVISNFYESMKPVIVVVVLFLILLALSSIAALAWKLNLIFEGLVLICLISIIVLLISIRKKIEKR